MRRRFVIRNGAATLAAGTLVLAPLLVAATSSASAASLRPAVNAPSIAALGALTSLTGHPGTTAVARFSVSAAAGAALTNGYVVFSSGPPDTASSLPLRSSIPGCGPVVLSPLSASNALGCALPPIAAGHSLTFTYSAPLPVTATYQVA